ncbi:hypothetical protein F444_16433, partial [Phytophthora nicotianae P1976]
MASSSTQLARVADCLPLLLTLRTNNDTTDNAPLCACIVVKIRPTLLHFLAANLLRCVIRSNVPITDVADYGGHHSEHGEARHKLLVSTADGNVWVVTLPGHLQLGVTRELLLERSSCENDDKSVQWFCQLPGVQSVSHIPAGPGLSSLTLMRSLVTPTTLIVSTYGSSGSKLQRHQSLELGELEGEQSTCTLCLNDQMANHCGLLRRLFPDVATDWGVTAILQGDLDGYVRFSLVHYPNKKRGGVKASVIRSGMLLRLGEPVQMIVPFSSSATTSSEGNGATATSQVFDALLVLGARGRIRIVEVKKSCSVEALSGSVKKLELGCAVQSLVFVYRLAVFAFCSTGSAFVCRSTDLLSQAQSIDSNAPTSLSDGSNVSTEKLPLQLGIIRLATHGSEGGLSILFASGRITTINSTALHTMVTSVLPLSGQQQNHKCGKSSELGSESRVRNLLHRIAEISSESTNLRTKSKQMDFQLKTLHSALETLRLVETTGVESVVKCNLNASMTMTGIFSDRQTIQLVCSFGFVNPEAIISLDDWRLCLYVRTHQRSIMTCSFPLNDITARGEQSIILDPDTLAQQDQGSLWVSCSMVFCPSRNGYPENERSNTSHIGASIIAQDDPLSFAIPLLQDKRFLFAQLSRPIEEEIPTSQVAIHAAFRQSHEPFMPVGRATKEGKSSSSVLWSGVQWWAALTDHAHRNPSFAALWSKISPSDAAPLALTPPSRFVIAIPSFFATEDDEDDEDEDENFEKLRLERMVSFLRQLLEIPSAEVPRLRRSCRTQHGKLWTVLRAFSGSLILLRFTPSEDQQRSVDLTIQCSDVADLSAMRALVLETINNWNDGSPTGINEEDRSDELALDVSEILEPIADLDNLLEDLTLKIRSIEDPNSACCTDEVLRALSQLAHLETQTLTLYWKTRMHLNRTIM